MPTTLTTPPPEEPVSIAEARAHLRVDTDADDALVVSLIAAARLQVEHDTGRALVSQRWTLVADGFPRRHRRGSSSGTSDWQFDGLPTAPNTIRLPIGRVRSVVSVGYVDPDGTDQTLAADDYRVTIAAGVGIVRPAPGLYWPATRHQADAVTIVFAAGDDSASDVDQRAKQAMLLLIGDLYEIRTATNIGNIVNVLPAYSNLIAGLRMF